MIEQVNEYFYNPDSSVKEIFNSLDLNQDKGAVSISELKNYAHKEKNNFFFASNYFTNIFITDTINGINSSVLNYLDGLNFNILDKFNEILEKFGLYRDLTNNLFDGEIFYDLSNTRFKVSSTKYVDDTRAELKNEILDGVGPAFDTLKELADELVENETITTQLINNIATQRLVNSLELASKAPINNPTFTGVVNGITKSMVGLDQVDNTSDLNKPISMLTQSALNQKADISYIEQLAETNLQTQFNVNQADANLQTQITSLDSTKADLTYVNQSDTTLQNNLNTVQTTLQNGINLKANSLNPVFSGTVSVSNGVNNSATQLRHSGIDTLFISNTENSHYSFRGQNADGIDTTNRFFILPNASSDGYYNNTSKKDDVLIFGAGNTNDVRSLNMTVWSVTATGVRIQPTRTTMTGGDNTIVADASTGIQLNGSNLSVNCNTTIAGNLNMNFSDIFARSLALSNTLFAVNVSTQDLTVNGNATISGNLAITAGNINLSGNLNMANYDIAANNISIKKSASIMGSAEFIPNVIIETSFQKTFGTSNIYSGYISVSQFERRIIVSIPISIYRQYRNVLAGGSFANIIEDTLTSVDFVIQKNGLFYSSGSCSYSDTLPKTIRMSSTSSTTSRNYEVYMTNATFSFLPTYETTTSIYTIYLTPNYSINIPLQQSNIIIETFGYFSNTNQSGSTGNLTFGTAGLNYTSTAYQLSHSGIYATGNGSIKTTSLLSNDINVQNSISSNSLVCSQGFISTANITSASINSATFVDGVKMNNGLAGYHIDGTANFLSTPVFCSMKSFGRANTDNYWFLNPGFKIEIYNGNDYVSFLKTMDNTNGTAGVVYTLADVERDRTDSFKVYYLGTEISFSPLS